jgi:alpha-mannosidase
MALNTPLIPVSSANELSQKPLPPASSVCSLDADNLVITALKKAETDGAIVLRAFEIRGDSAESSVRFLGQDRKFRAANLLEEVGPMQEENVLCVGPYEISTIKLRLPESTRGTQ